MPDRADEIAREMRERWTYCSAAGCPDGCACDQALAAALRSYGDEKLEEAAGLFTRTPINVISAGVIMQTIRSLKSQPIQDKP